MNNTSKLALGIAAILILLFSFYLVPKTWETVDAGEIVVIQDAIDGELHVYKQPGMVTQLFGTVTHYKKSKQFWFSQGKEKDEPDLSIAVKWNDGGHATLSGSASYDLPLDDRSIINIHSACGSQEAIESRFIKTNIEKAVYMTGPLMTSKESYAEKRNDLIYYIEDQASRGVYKTKQKEVEETDQLTGMKKLVTRVEVQNDKNGNPFRQEQSPIIANGIKLYNISINAITYDKNVEKQIATQQKATMQVQTAIAEAKSAEQRALTVAKQGEADAAQAKWTQEVIKARTVTEAEQRKAVAALDVQTAELNKRKAILEGEGEAAKKKLLIQANGALEQKLEAYVTVQRFWADAFSKYGGAVVSQFSMGGDVKGTNGALDFMKIMGAKAALDLNMNLNVQK